MRRLIFICCGILTGAGGSEAQQASPKRMELGRQWKVHQWILPTVDLTGKWTRVGDSNVFDVDYTNKANGTHVYSKVTVLSKTANKIVVAIPRTNAQLIGNIALDGRTIRGTLVPCPAGNSCGWSVETDWQPPAEEVARRSAATRSVSIDDLGTQWKVHDYTNEGYDYYGTWTLPKSGDTIEFVYKNKADGTEARGSFLLGTVSGRGVQIFNQGRRKYMRGTVQADGKRIKGTADWCRDSLQCGWEATIVK